MQLAVVLPEEACTGHVAHAHVPPKADAGEHDERLPVDLREAHARSIREGMALRCIDEEVLRHHRQGEHAGQGERLEHDREVHVAVEDGFLQRVFVHHLRTADSSRHLGDDDRGESPERRGRAGADTDRTPDLCQVFGHGSCRRPRQALRMRVCLSGRTCG